MRILDTKVYYTYFRGDIPVTDDDGDQPHFANYLDAKIDRDNWYDGTLPEIKKITEELVED